MNSINLSAVKLKISNNKKDIMAHFLVILRKENNIIRGI
jgi:hypothetical protein